MRCRTFFCRVDPAEWPAYPLAGSHLAVPISSCLQMKKVYRVVGIIIRKRKKKAAHAICDSPNIVASPAWPSVP